MTTTVHQSPAAPATSSLKLQTQTLSQNTAARLVLPHSHLSTANRLSQLHWLPISRRIDFKLATLIYKILKFQHPAYLSSLIRPDVPARLLRSSALHKLHVPTVETSFGERALSSASPAIFNSLPLSIRSAPSLNSLKTQLNTLYFGSLD